MLLRLQLRKPIIRFFPTYFSTAMETPTGPVESSIRDKLNLLLKPTSLLIANDSWKHRHHAAMQQQGGGGEETHFSIQVVSELFKGKNTLQRHRMIYSALTEEFSNGVHALSLKTRTEDEVQA